MGVPKENINAEYIEKLRNKLGSLEQELIISMKEQSKLEQEQADLMKWKKDVDIYLGKTQEIDKEVNKSKDQQIE